MKNGIIIGLIVILFIATCGLVVGLDTSYEESWIKYDACVAEYYQNDLLEEDFESFVKDCLDR